MEARGGIEPPIKVLQTFALPLGHRAVGKLRVISCQFLGQDRYIPGYRRLVVGHHPFDAENRPADLPLPVWRSLARVPQTNRSR